MKPKNHGKKWTEEDDTYLEQKWGTVSMETIMNTLQRSEFSILNRYKLLNLGSFQEGGGLYIAPTQIAKILGMSQKGIYYWIETKKLPARKRKVKVHYIHQVKIDDLMKFLKDNQDLWDSRKVELFALGEEPEWLKQKRRIDSLKEDTRIKSPWTKQEEKDLLRYRAEGLTAREIAEKLNRSEAGINVRLSLLRRQGVNIPMKKIMIPWTKEEERMMLKLEKQGLTDSQIAYELGRERNDIAWKRMTLRRKGKYKGTRELNQIKK